MKILKTFLVSTAFLPLIFSFTSCADKEITAATNPYEEKNVEICAGEFLSSLTNSDLTKTKSLIETNSSAEQKFKSFSLNKIITGAGKIGIKPENLMGYSRELSSKYSFETQKISFDGSKAIVKTKATVPDIDSAVENAMSPEILNEYLKAKGINKNELKKLVTDVAVNKSSEKQNEFIMDYLSWVFPKVTKSIKTESRDVTLTLKKSNDTWIVCDIKNLF